MVGTRLAALLLLVAAPAVGQSVRGQLTDSITRTPLPGAFLTLLDDQGVERARTITNTAGEFLLTAPAPGTYRLRSKRIGFRPYVSAALTLRAGETSGFNAAIDPIPVALSEVVVEGERQCDIESGASVAALWDEAREALAAVSWTSRVPAYWYHLTDFQRELSAGGRRRGEDSTWTMEGFSLNPIRNFTTEEQFEREGYVIVTDTGWIYRAPDADVLLSRTFLRTHCFDVQKGKGQNEGLLGLDFTTARDRRVPEITGTLWLDRKTSELRRLQFKYIRLPQDVVAPEAGGSIEFLRLPSGVWIVRDWGLRMPLLRLIQQVMAMGNKPEVVGFLETGGTINTIKTASGRLVFGTPAEMALAAAPPPPAPPPTAPPAPPTVPSADTSTAAPVATAAAATKPGRALSRNPYLITTTEVQGSTAMDAYTLIQELRPTWLHSRGTISLNDPTAGEVQVYLDGEQFGDLNKLREIARRDIREVRFYNAAQAQMRWGLGHAGGVIDVAVGVIAPAQTASASPPPPAPPAETPIVPVAAEPGDTLAPASPPKPAQGAPLGEIRRRAAVNQNVLTPEEFEGTAISDVFRLIEHYRPNWLLRNRGPVSIYDRTAGDTRVYFNGVFAGDLGRLHEFRVEDIRELRFLNAGDAQQRYGLGNAGGAIEVWTK